MTASQIAFRIADTCPPLAEAGVRAWASRYTHGGRHEHWLFRELRTRLNVRFRRTVRMSTGDLVCVDPFEFVGAEIVSGGCYEPETVTLVERLVQPGMTVLDIGANVGQYTMIASRLVGQRGAVHSFEPEPSNFACLSRGVRLNGRANVRCNQIALADRQGTATLHLASESRNAGAHSLAATHHSTGSVVEVTIGTLDEYAATLAALDVVKLDVEGAELAVLRGGRRSIDRFHPSIVVELSDQNSRPFGYTSDVLAGWLLDRGYLLFLVGALPLEQYVTSADAPDSFNVLAVHASRVSQLGALGVVGR